MHSASEYSCLVFYALAVMVMAVVGNLLESCPLTLDPSRWFFGRSALVLLMVIAVAVWGFRTALAGRPLFGEAVLEE